MTKQLQQFYERSIGGEIERMVVSLDDPHCAVSSRFGRGPIQTTDEAPLRRSIGPSSNDHASRPGRFVDDPSLYAAQLQCAQRYREHVADLRDEDDRRKLMSGD